MAGEIDPRDLRVSDAEREHIGKLLERAVGQGRLTLAEFESRMAASLAARTRAELNAQVVDIAEVTLQQASKDVLELRSGIGSIKRRGYWLVPPTIRVTSGVGEVLLDFTEAVLSSRVTTIEVKLGLGELTVIVPPEATVDHDDLHTNIGEIKDRTQRLPGAAGPHFVIRGTTTGGVKLKNPRRRRWGGRTQRP